MIEPKIAPSPRDTRVMVVEDESRLRELLHRVLTSWGFCVTVACTGEDALKSAQAQSPEIVIIDLNLPGIGGIDLLRSLREIFPEIQAIILTGYATLDAAKQAIHLGVAEFMTKPCHLGELERAMDKAIRRLYPCHAISVETPAQGAEGMTLDELERAHILATLEQNRGNRTATASTLGISRRTLYCKLLEYESGGTEGMPTSPVRAEPLHD